MDFRNRNSRPANINQTINPGDVQTPSPDADTSGVSKKKPRVRQVINPINLVMLFCIAIVLLGVTLLAILIKEPNESKYINEDELQAVFLDGGQVYFGSIGELNDEFLRLHNIYYLRVDQQVQPEQEGQQAEQQISLAKLGCELHGPHDMMIINRDKVIFWENLKDDGQVTQAVKQFIQANPDGQDCDVQQQQQPANNNGSNGNQDEEEHQE